MYFSKSYEIKTKKETKMNKLTYFRRAVPFGLVVVVVAVTLVIDSFFLLRGIDKNVRSEGISIFTLCSLLMQLQ